MNHIEQDNSRFHPPIWFTDYDEAKRLAQAMPNQTNVRDFLELLTELSLIDSGLANIAPISILLIHNLESRLGKPHIIKTRKSEKICTWKIQLPTSQPTHLFRLIVTTGNNTIESKAYVDFSQLDLAVPPEESNPLQPRLL